MLSDTEFKGVVPAPCGSNTPLVLMMKKSCKLGRVGAGAGQKHDRIKPEGQEQGESRAEAGVGQEQGMNSVGAELRRAEQSRKRSRVGHELGRSRVGVGQGRSTAGAHLYPNCQEHICQEHICIQIVLKT